MNRGIFKTALMMRMESGMAKVGIANRIAIVIVVVRVMVEMMRTIFQWAVMRPGCASLKPQERSQGIVRLDLGNPKKKEMEKWQNFFATEVEILEIVLNVAPRDVRKRSKNGSEERVINQKPKNHDEVCFRELEEKICWSLNRPWTKRLILT